MNIILWIILGGIAGWIASIVMRTDREQGLIANIIIGIVGALIGGFIMSFFSQPGVSGFNVYSLLVAIVGAIILIAIGRLFRRGTTS